MPPTLRHRKVKDDSSLSTKSSNEIKARVTKAKTKSSRQPREKTRDISETADIATSEEMASWAERVAGGAGGKKSYAQASAPASTSSTPRTSVPASTAPFTATSTFTSTTSNVQSRKKPTLATASTPAPSSSDSGPVYFWKPGESNGYLGQWYTSSFTYKGESYANAEQWMMVGKARLFSDEKIAKQMLKTADPKKIKALGRQVKNFDNKTWDAEKLNIVTKGTYLKFRISRDHERLQRMLLATGDRELVEASPFDRIWGIGFKEAVAEQSRVAWGENLLGKALMDVRTRIREEISQGIGPVTD